MSKKLKPDLTGPAPTSISITEKDIWAIQEIAIGIFDSLHTTPHPVAMTVMAMETFLARKGLAPQFTTADLRKASQHDSEQYTSIEDL